MNKKELYRRIDALRAEIQDGHKASEYQGRLCAIAQFTTESLRISYEQTVSLLDPNKRYDLVEELRSGTVVTHLQGETPDELNRYIRKVFIHSHPPRFLIRASVFNENDLFIKELIND